MRMGADTASSHVRCPAGLGRHREVVENPVAAGTVCRHDIGLACRLAAEKKVGHRILHVVIPSGLQPPSIMFPACARGAF